MIICKTFVCVQTDHRWVIGAESRMVILAGKQIESSTEYLMQLFYWKLTLVQKDESQGNDMWPF